MDLVDMGLLCTSGRNIEPEVERLPTRPVCPPNFISIGSRAYHMPHMRTSIVTAKNAYMPISMQLIYCLHILCIAIGIDAFFGVTIDVLLDILY